MKDGTERPNARFVERSSKAGHRGASEGAASAEPSASAGQDSRGDD
jgi:hypothetical protein